MKWTNLKLVNNRHITDISTNTVIGRKWHRNSRWHIGALVRVMEEVQVYAGFDDYDTENFPTFQFQVKSYKTEEDADACIADMDNRIGWFKILDQRVSAFVMNGLDRAHEFTDNVIETVNNPLDDSFDAYLRRSERQRVEDENEMEAELEKEMTMKITPTHDNVSFLETSKNCYYGLQIEGSNPNRPDWTWHIAEKLDGMRFARSLVTDVEDDWKDYFKFFEGTRFASIECMKQFVVDNITLQYIAKRGYAVSCGSVFCENVSEDTLHMEVYYELGMVTAWHEHKKGHWYAIETAYLDLERKSYGDGGGTYYPEGQDVNNVVVHVSSRIDPSKSFDNMAGFKKWICSRTYQGHFDGHKAIRFSGSPKK